MKTVEKTSVALALRMAECLSTTSPIVTGLDQGPIPSCSAIVEIIGTIKQILFPGFCEPPTTSQQNTINDYLESKLDDLIELLGRQISIAFALDENFCATEDSVASGSSRFQVKERGHSLACEFANRLPEIRKRLSTDITAAYEGDPACRNLCEVILCYPGLQAITVYRVAHELYKMQIPLLPRMMAEWVHGETGIDIHPGARIGNHFFIDHGTGVVIGQTCEIGEKVKIYQGVTLGALSFPTDGQGELVRDTKRHPTLQDRVVIYANATVLGGRTVVGHDSVIGSSVWLTRSVDPFTTIIMEKPKLHLRDGTPSDFEPPIDYQI